MKSISIVRYALFMAFAIIALQAPAQSISAGGCTMSQVLFHFPFNSEFQFFTLQCPETAWFVRASNSDRGLQIEGASFLREGVSIRSSARPTWRTTSPCTTTARTSMT